MKRLAIVILALSCLSSATVRYIAQSAGTFTGGTACNGQTAITPATWNATTLAAGDVSWVCGTLTFSLGASGLIVHDGGASGNPVIIRFDTGAIIQSPAFASSAGGSNAGGIAINGKSFVTIDGNNLTGTIQNTANGSSLANHVASTLISGFGCNGCTVMNLNLLNAYINVNGNSVIGDSSVIRAIDPNGPNWTISGNVFSNCGWCVFSNYANNDTNEQYYNNTFTEFGHAFAFATSGANACTAPCVFFFNNDMNSGTSWDAAGCFAHKDGIHLFGNGTTSTMDGVYGYNNYFHGDWGTCSTGFVFSEAGGSDPGIKSQWWWNNVGVVGTTTTNTNGWFLLASGHSGSQYVVSNTMIGPGVNDNTLCMGLQNMSALTYENNTLSGCGEAIAIHSSTLTAADYNLYGANNCQNGGNCFDWNVSFKGTFAAWKTACACDAHSVSNLTPLLNTDGSPQSGSLVIGAGTNLSSLATGNLATLQNDTTRGATRTVIARPGTGAWAIGAYQFSAPAGPGAAYINVTTGRITVSAGKVTVNSGSGPAGAPLTYTARTDTCVTGAEAGCTGLGLSFQMRTTDTVPFPAYPSAVAGTLTKDPDFHTFILMVSDWATKTYQTNWVVNNNAQQTFSLDSSLFLLTNNNGGFKVFAMNPTAIRAAEASYTSGAVACSGCVAATNIANGTVGGCTKNCTTLDATGPAQQVWSSVAGENQIMYELAGDGVTVNKLTMNAGCTVSGAASCSFNRTPYIQFTSNTYGSGACSVLPSNFRTSGWAGILDVGPGGEISYSTGGGADWTATTAYTTTDSFIYPSVGNTNKIFQATTGGTSGSTEPTWSTSCPNAGQTCTDGTVTWTNIGVGTGQGPGFWLVDYRPGIGCSLMNTYIGKIYRAAGSAEPAGAIQTDDDIICAEYGTTPCPLPDRFTIHDGGQTPNGAYSALTPTGGGGACNSGFDTGTCSCTATNANYLGAYNAASTYNNLTHDTVYGSDLKLYVAKISVPVSTPPPNATYWNAADYSCFTYVWEKATIIERPLMSRGSTMHGYSDGHAVDGYVAKYKGQLEYSHLWSKPSVGGAANPGNSGVAILPTGGLPSDYHGTWNNDGTQDYQPAGFCITDVPTATYAINGNQAWYGEMIMNSFNQATNVPTNGSPVGFVKGYRMGHFFNTGSNPGYGSQNNICSVSSDGQWVLSTTDMMGTRGSGSPAWAASHVYAFYDHVFHATAQNTQNNEFYASVAGTSGTVEPNWDACATSGGANCVDGGVTWTSVGNSCNQLRAMYAPAASTTFAANSAVFPVTNNGSFYIYTTTAGGTTGATIPNWGSTCGTAFVGQNCPSLDGTVQWFNAGKNTCRSDVFLGDLLSAH